MGQPTARSISRALRVAVANQIIEAIGSCGRRFLSTNSDVWDPGPAPRFSRFELVDGRLWYVDKYRESRIFVHYDPPARSGWGWRFSDGGTLLDLLKHLRNFIVAGIPINPRYFGPFPQWRCGGDHWGYGADMPVLRAKVEAIIAQWETDQQMCCASCGGDRAVEKRFEAGGIVYCRQYARCAVCGGIAINERVKDATAEV